MRTEEFQVMCKAANNRINSDWQFRCAPLPAGYAERYVLKGKVKLPAHRAGHLKTTLAAWGISLVRDGTECIS